MLTCDISLFLGVVMVRNWFLKPDMSISLFPLSDIVFIELFLKIYKICWSSHKALTMNMLWPCLGVGSRKNDGYQISIVLFLVGMGGYELEKQDLR